MPLTRDEHLVQAEVGHDPEDERVKYFYDTEFIDDGVTIELISIGIVTPGREYYAISNEFSWSKFHENSWLVQNVLPSLIPAKQSSIKSRKTIAFEVEDFLLAGGGVPELWAACAAFDHVCLAWLWGPMVNLPRGLPYYTHDLVQEWERQGLGPPPEQESLCHHALGDARHNLRLARILGIVS